MVSKNEGENDSENETVSFHKLFRYSDWADVALMVMGAVGAVLAGSTLPVLVHFFGETLNCFSPSVSASRQQQLNTISKTSLKCAVGGVIAAVGYFFQVSCWATTGNRQANRIRYLYLQALLRQDASFFDRGVSTGFLVESMTADSFHIQQATGEQVGKLLQIFGTFVSGFAVAFTQGWKLTLVMSALLPLLVVTGYAMDTTITRTSKETFLANGFAGSIIEQVISAIRTVMAFSGERKALKDYDKELKKAERASLQAGMASGLGMGAIMFFTFNIYGLMLWFGSRLIVEGGYNGGEIITVLFSVIIGTGALNQCSTCLSAFALGTGAAQKMFPVIHRIPDVDIKDVTGIELENLKGSISFENVKFAYPSRKAYEIFSDFSLAIPDGVPVALVGESGSGKSTIVSLIERFYDPQGGAVLIDGVNLKELKLSWFRQQLGLVSQEPVLFETTVRENIMYGKGNATFKEIETAAQLANASKFISRLPKGYDTMVGQGGLQLSGGQKQRIAIARAVIKDPRILLLDEATSSLDAESESVVHEALEKIMLNRTTIIIAHRLTTVKNAHFIAVLNRGQIVEKGSHSELLSNPDGIFSQLVRLDERRKIEERETEVDVETMEIDQRQDYRLEGTAVHRKVTSVASSRSLSFGSVGSMGSVGSIVQNETERKLQVWRRMDNPSARDDDSNDSITCSHIFRLAAHNRPDIPVLIVGTLAAVANGAVMPVLGLLFVNIINTFYGPTEKITSGAMLWVYLFVAIGCMSLVLVPLQAYCFTIAGDKLIRRIRLLTFDKVLHQQIAWFDLTENASGVISSRLLRDAVHVRTIIGDALGLIAQNLSTVIVGLFIALSSCWQLALLFLGMLPFYCLDGVMQIKLGETFDSKAKEMYEESSRVAHEALSSIRTVASFCAESKVLEFYKAKSDIAVGGASRRAVIAGVGMAVTYMVMFGSLSLSFWISGLLIWAGKVDFYRFLKTFFAIELGAYAISLSAALAPDLSNLKPAITSIFSMLDLEVRELGNGTKLKRLKGEVEFRHAQFKYPSRPDVQIFHDLCFTLQAGKTLALVGESGGGKSTVIALMQRFYDLDGGQILLDRVDIKELQIKWLRRQMGLVSQEPYLFNDTIRANIEYGIEEEVSENEVQQAAIIANAHKFISSLPRGYECVVGERGIQLSGGQKQRVAIARAMVRDPKVMLLDEATSSLDAESELEVQQALEKAALGRSTIVVAHRLSTVRNVDMIVYLKHGVIVEEGTHDELMRLENGLYAALVKISQSTTSYAKPKA